MGCRAHLGPSPSQVAGGAADPSPGAGYTPGEPLVPARGCPWNWLLMAAGGSLADLPSVHARRADVTPEGPLQGGDAGLFSSQVELWPSPPGGSSGWRP